MVPQPHTGPFAISIQEDDAARLQGADFAERVASGIGAVLASAGKCTTLRTSLYCEGERRRLAA